MYMTSVLTVDSSDDALPVCLSSRLKNPYRLVSLLAMLEMNAADYLWIAAALRHMAMEMEAAPDQSGKMNVEYTESLRPGLREAAARCQLLELPVAKASAEYWEKEFGKVETRSWAEGRCAIEEIERVIGNELKNFTFLYLSRDRLNELQKMLNEVRELWDRPWDVALENLDRARFCYRVDEFTASVFHSMRSAEKILVTVAASLNIDSAREQWQTLIERIESAVRDLDKLPKGDPKESKQTFYSEVAMQLRYIKNAWRNHVMHARRVYEEKDAREIWWHVKRMVEFASSELEEELEI